MVEVRQTQIFEKWLAALRDRSAAAVVIARLRRVELGNMGDVRPVGDGVSELRINHGPGYRVYLVQRGAEVVVVLAGGDKSSQTRDINKAKALAKQLEE